MPGIEDVPPSSPLPEEVPTGAEPFDLDTGYQGVGPGQPTPPDAVPCLTCFLVVLGVDGHAYAELDTSKDFVAQRAPSANDIAAAAYQVMSDFEAMKVAANVANIMSQQAQAMMQQAQANQLAAQLGMNPQGPNRMQRRHGG